MNGGNDIFWQVVRSTAEVFLLSGVELILSAATLILFLVATVQLYRKSHIAGSKLILIALGGFIIGYVTYSTYLYIPADEAIQVIDDLYGVYMSACFALGTYGYWLLSKSVIKSANDKI